VTAPTGFTWSARKNGEIAIGRDGRIVTVVRGRSAERLTQRLEAAADDHEVQHLLARATGNYRRGNERP
jgi:zona occludens toxin (predicted ATPase)